MHSYQFNPLTDENDSLCEVVASIATPNFTNSLLGFIASQVYFDIAVICGYGKSQRPVFLHRYAPPDYPHYFIQYINGLYLHDPYHIAVVNKCPPGVFQLNEVIEFSRDKVQNIGQMEQYITQFHKQTGWHDILGLFINIDHEKWVVIYLGQLSPRAHFDSEAKHILTENLSLITSLCRQHFRRQHFTLSASPQGSCNIREAIESSLHSFGQELLSCREQEVLAHLIQGFNSGDIAEQLKISHGTVKIHRKKIYAKLNAKSLGDLFQLFLNHLILVGADHENERFQTLKVE